MNNKEKEFYLHKHYAYNISSNTTNINNKENTKSVTKQETKVFELSHIKTGERLIYGNYALCKHKFNSLNPKDRKDYVICRYKR